MIDDIQLGAKAKQLVDAVAETGVSARVRTAFRPSSSRATSSARSRTSSSARTAPTARHQVDAGLRSCKRSPNRRF